MMGIMGFYRTLPEDYRTELGYMILPEYHGKGYMTEAVKTLLNFGFNTLNFHSICAIIDDRNIASEKVLLKNGFQQEGHFKEDTFYNNEFSSSKYFGILKKEFNFGTS
jgi:[ribosomal protein S5]-alanine N-acetyltransferase